MFDYGKSGVDGGKLPKPTWALPASAQLPHRPGARRGGLPRRELLPRGGRRMAVRPVGARPGHRHRRSRSPRRIPDFIGYWLRSPIRRIRSSLTVYALLDSPSVSGAYRFVITPGDTRRWTWTWRCIPRKAIDRMGIAPCTSMFQTGENDRRMGYDWRPRSMTPTAWPCTAAAANGSGARSPIRRSCSSTPCQDNTRAVSA
jgi:glucans biosynthesis protein